MPITYRIFAAEAFVLSTALGNLSDAELLGHQLELMGDSKFDPGYPQLDDLRGADMDNVTAACIQTLARTQVASKRCARRALLVGSDVAYGLARMLQALREGNQPEIRVFRDVDQALGWLGVS